MDVKDVTSPGTASDQSKTEAETKTRRFQLDIAAEEAAIKVDSLREERAEEIRDTANQIINIVNVAADATGEIEKLVKSIAGIVDQASRLNPPEKRLTALQSEANQLVDAIKTKVQSARSGSVNPLTGDQFALEAREEIGKRIEVKLPEHAKDNFGLAKIDLSGAESIANTRNVVQRAQGQLENLKKAVGDSKQAVHSTVAELDVALQNSEASRVSVRDLDAALKLAGDTKTSISRNPHGALGSFTNFSKRALDLLE